MSLFENAVDIDGDGGNDVAAGLSIVGLGLKEKAGSSVERGLIQQLNQFGFARISMESKVLDHDPLWDDMASMEVSMMKALHMI